MLITFIDQRRTEGQNGDLAILPETRARGKKVFDMKKH